MLLLLLLRVSLTQLRERRHHAELNGGHGDRSGGARAEDEEDGQSELVSALKLDPQRHRQKR